MKEDLQTANTNFGSIVKYKTWSKLIHMYNFHQITRVCCVVTTCGIDLPLSDDINIESVIENIPVCLDVASYTFSFKYAAFYRYSCI